MHAINMDRAFRCIMTMTIKVCLDHNFHRIALWASPFTMESIGPATRCDEMGRFSAILSF